MGRASRNRLLSLYMIEVRVRVRGVKALDCATTECKNAIRWLVGPSTL